METISPPAARITVREISRRLKLGYPAIYDLLDRGAIPGVRAGRNWLILREPYLHWERTGRTS